MKTWKLKRTVQCEKCPWKESTNPYEIPNNYDRDKHAALASTIADPGSLRGLGGPANVMECHETNEAICIGYLVNQLGPGNNIGLRLRMMSCENRDKIRTVGPQHATFEDTIPEEP